MPLVTLQKYFEDPASLGTVDIGTGGTIPLQINPYPFAPTGGSSSLPSPTTDTGFVSLIGPQDVIAEKTWKASQWFEQDVSIAANVYVTGGRTLEDNGFLVREASLGDGFSWTVDGSLQVDGMDYDYIDGSLAARDVSIAWLVNDNLNQDASIEAAFGSMDYAYVDGSLAARDTSIAWLVADNLNQDASIEAAFGSMDYIYVDGSLAARDTSIAWLVADNLNQDTSIAGAYASSADSSLSDLIDVSIGSPANGDILEYNATTTEWNNGATEALDASIMLDDLYMTDKIYMGDPDASDGGWRFGVDASENMRFEKKVAGVWTYKYAIT